MQRLPEGVAARNKAIRAHKNDAKRRNIEQTLTDEQIIELHKQPCHYCGALPSNVLFSKCYYGSYIYNGIDRIDNNKGYTITNTVSCCNFCNRAKGIHTYDEFLSWIKQAYSNLILYNVL